MNKKENDIIWDYPLNQNKIDKTKKIDNNTKRKQVDYKEENIKLCTLFETGGYVMFNQNKFKTCTNQQTNIRKNNFNTVSIENRSSFILFIYYSLIAVSFFVLVFFLSISLSSAAEKSPIQSVLPKTQDVLKENYKSISDKITVVSEEKVEYVNQEIKYTIYQIKSRDTLASIALQYKITAETIALCNNISHINLIKKGQKLIIPNQNGRKVIVKNNDSVEGLARRYGVSWKKIADINNLENTVLFVGQQLFIPGSIMSKDERFKFTYVKPVVRERINTKTEYAGISMKWPVKGDITSYFGMRLDPFKKFYIFHSGVDIKKDEGDPVLSAAEGVVSYTGWTNVYGNFIMVKHTNSLISLYGHLSSVDVKKGDVVNAGACIGKVGNTGRSTGPHLHFEVREKNIPIDPLKILPALE